MIGISIIGISIIGIKTVRSRSSDTTIVIFPSNLGSIPFVPSPGPSCSLQASSPSPRGRFRYRLTSVPDSQYTVIKMRGGAEKRIIHTLRVQLEAGIAGIHGNRDGSNISNCIHMCINVTSRDFHVSGTSGSNCGLLETAFIILGLVRVTGLGVNPSDSFYILESIVHEPTLTTVITVFLGAIHRQLLFGEVQEGSLLERSLALQGPGGGKGPARPALLLVLDG